jgi:hypothetical protein
MSWASYLLSPLLLFSHNQWHGPAIEFLLSRFSAGSEFSPLKKLGTGRKT